MSDDTERLDSVGRSVKLLVGYSFNAFGKLNARLSVEGSLGRNDMLLKDGSTGGAGQMLPYGHLYQASASAKLNFPIGDNFELFGRGGLLHMNIDAADRPENVRDMAKVSGNGLLVGAGVEYRLNLGFAGGASIFLDYTIANADLTSDVRTDLKFDTTTRVWTLGLTIGL